MDTLGFTETLKQKILDSVRQDPSIEHVILFGSFAYGNPTKDSDLDLIIIMDNKEKTSSYTEKWNRYIRVSRLLKGIRKLYPLDVLIYTIDEWNLLMTSDSSFLVDIKSKGITLQWKVGKERAKFLNIIVEIHDIFKKGYGSHRKHIRLCNIMEGTRH